MGVHDRFFTPAAISAPDRQLDQRLDTVTRLEQRSSGTALRPIRTRLEALHPAMEETNPG